jgi:hypothetical protein
MGYYGSFDRDFWNVCERKFKGGTEAIQHIQQLEGREGRVEWVSEDRFEVHFDGFSRFATPRSDGHFSPRRGTLVIDDPLALQLFQELADVTANLFWIGNRELFLQLGDDLSERALAVAALQNLAPGALQLDGAFGEEDDAVFFAAAPAASGGKAGPAGI